MPGGCTKFVQAPDVCWNKPFKAKITEYYEDWLLSGEKSYTPAGNMHAVSVDIYLEWVLNAWESISKELIQNSFKVCGISNAVDGSEDDLVHCFKDDGPCPEGRQLLQTEADKLNSEEEIVIAVPNEAEDKGENEENGYASDASLTY